MDKKINIEEQKKHVVNFRKGIYILPNLFTTMTVFSGFYSIIAALDGNFVLSAIAIIIAGIFDALDGRIARLTNTTSQFGVEYDSLADLVAFGMAPAILMFLWALRPFGKYGWLAAFLFLICGALRLARFNIQVEVVEKKYFKGLPIPTAAGLIATTVLIAHHFGIDHMARSIIILIEVYALALLMVSEVRYYSFKEINKTDRTSFIIFVSIIFVLIAIVAEPQIMLFTLAFTYTLSGPLLLIFRLTRKYLFRKGTSAEKPS